MTIHFRNRELAIADLKAHGYHELKNGGWAGNGFVAMIHPIPGSTAVRVSYGPVGG